MVKSIMQNEKECWKDISGYEGKYQISNKGRIKSILFTNNQITKKQDKIMKPQLRNKYLIINLSKDSKRKQYSIHRLVAQEFIKNPNNYNVVNHLDYNTLNNNADNLEWCTQKQNVKHSVCHMKGKAHMRMPKELYGITYREKYNNYELAIKQKYYGKYKTLEEAKKKRDEILNELNIAIR